MIFEVYETYEEKGFWEEIFGLRGKIKHKFKGSTTPFFQINYTS